MPDPHDLLMLTGPADWLPDDAPDWVAAALRAAPWVVVRRACAVDGRIAVGVRGAGRHQRYAAWLDAGRIAARVTPGQLLGRQPVMARRALPAMDLLALLQDLLAARGLAGGPTGSAGFELASGWPAVGATSDLDLLLRPAGPLTVPAAQQLWAALQEQAQRSGCRVDVQVEGAAGAFALADYAQHRRVLLRTARGAFLTVDPWRDR